MPRKRYSQRAAARLAKANRALTHELGQLRSYINSDFHGTALYTGDFRDELTASVRTARMLGHVVVVSLSNQRLTFRAINPRVVT